MEAQAQVLRSLMVIVDLGMMLLACFYLRMQKLSFAKFLKWGLVSVCLPYLGPFLAILLSKEER